MNEQECVLKGAKARLVKILSRLRLLISIKPRYFCIKHNRAFLDIFDANFHSMLAQEECEWEERDMNGEGDVIQGK